MGSRRCSREGASMNRSFDLLENQSHRMFRLILHWKFSFMLQEIFNCYFCYILIYETCVTIIILHWPLLLKVSTDRRAKRNALCAPTIKTQKGTDILESFVSFVDRGATFPLIIFLAHTKFHISIFFQFCITLDTTKPRQTCKERVLCSWYQFIDILSLDGV